MKIINKRYSEIFRLADHHPNTAKYLLQQLPDAYQVSIKEIKNNHYTSPFAMDIQRFIKENKKCSFIDFWANSFEFLTKKSKMSIESRPPFYVSDDLDGGVLGYIPGKNMILASLASCKKFKDLHKFALMGHEIKHATQLYDGLRIENSTDTMLEKLVDYNLKDGRNVIFENCKNLTFDDIKALKDDGQINDQFYEIYIMAKNAQSDKAKLEDFEKLHSDTFKEHCKNRWKEIQSQIIKEQGTIKSNSPKAEKAKELFDSLLNMVEGSGEEYFNSKHEQDAYFTTRYLVDLYDAVRANNIKNFL